MLKIVVAGTELYDEGENRFSLEGGVVLELEHSLVSLSKWEEIHEKRFLSPGDKTEKEILSYIRCMTLTPNVSGEIFQKLSNENLREIHEHINRKMTATTFPQHRGGRSGTGEAISAELIYYWMTAYNVPFEPCQNWHLNKLFTLIRLAGLKQQKPKKMNRQEAARWQAELNAQRRAQMNTSG